MFPNQKPWLDSKVRPLLKTRDAAFRSSGMLAYSGARRDLKKGIKGINGLRNILRATTPTACGEEVKPLLTTRATPHRLATAETSLTP